jgi:hypothetical protein
MMDPLQFYREPGPLADPGARAELLAALPGDLGELCSAIQGLILHLHWAPAYGVELSAERRSQPNARSLPAILTHILERDPRPLCEPRALDVPADQFLVAGRAWDLALSGTDPARFGIHDMRGRYFIRGNLLRDLAALNRLELLPWDGWGLMLRLGQEDACDPADQALLDRVAALTQAGDDLEGLRELYAHPELRVPETVLNLERGVLEPIAPGPEPGPGR